MGANVFKEFTMKHLRILAITAVTAFILSSCGSGWSSSDKEEFLKSCKSGFGEAAGMDGEKYCECMLGKLEGKYSNPEDAQKNMDAKEMQDWAVECLK